MVTIKALYHTFKCKQRLLERMAVLLTPATQVDWKSSRGQKRCIECLEIEDVKTTTKKTSDFD
jgi:hypothetical protein